MKKSTRCAQGWDIHVSPTCAESRWIRILLETSRMTNPSTESNPTHPLLLTAERIVRLAPKMTQEERMALAEWEAEHLDGHSVGTTDWPGWAAVVARLSH